MAESFIISLDNLLSEFYSTSSNNARKAQIEHDLHNLKNTDNCWECCIQLLQQSTSQYSQWWALSTLEDFVAKKWLTVKEIDGNNLREFLYNGALKQNQIQFITVKYIKVFVNVGIRQWSTNPSFFHQIVELITYDVTPATHTGISMLLVLSEELNRSRHDIPSDLLHSSQQKLTEQIGGILTTLTGLLDKLRGLMNDKTSNLLSVCALQCLAHLLSWVSLVELLTPGLVNTIFQFAKQGLVGQPDLGVHAMACINEIVGRNLVPAQVEDFILQLFQQTLQLLTSVTDGDVASIESGYMKKLIEFLNLFTSGHLRRVESNSSFPVLEFLDLLFKFTDKQTDTEMFSSTIEVWGSWVDFLLSIQGSLSPDGTVTRYGGALTTLAGVILNKVRYQTNNDMLEDLDDTLDSAELRDVVHTEWDMFLGKLTQLLSKIIELHPVHISGLLLSHYKEHCQGLYQLHTHITITDKGAIDTDQLDSEVLCKHLRDVATVVHLAQLTLPSLVGDNFTSHQDVAQGILYHCMKCIQLSTRISQLQCRGEVVRGHSQVLESSVNVLTTFNRWFLQYGTAHPDQYCTIITTVLDAVLPAFHNQVEGRLQHSVIDLLYKIVVICRPSFILSIPSVQALLQGYMTGTFHGYSSIALNTLNKAVTLSIVLPWLHVSVTDQQWPAREERYKEFVSGLFSRLLQLDVSAVSTSAGLAAQTPLLTYYLTTLSDIVSCVAHRETKSKQVVCKAILPIVRRLVTLLPHFEKDSKIFEHVLSFTTVLCDALRVQLGAQFLRELVGLCMSNFTKNKGSNSDVAKTTIEKFIELLATVVREPSSVFRGFTGDIIGLTLNSIKDSVGRSPSVGPLYYTLLHSILDYYWSYFYPRQAAERESCSHLEEFLGLLNILGGSLMKTDFNIIKQNVVALCDLHDKHELFVKHVFVENLKENFIMVLLNLLFSGSMPIIDEELEDTLFQLATAKSERESNILFTSVLSKYLGSILPQNVLAGVLAKVEKPFNSASFKLNIKLVVNDVKFIVNCGS